MAQADKSDDHGQGRVGDLHQDRVRLPDTAELVAQLRWQAPDHTTWGQHHRAHKSSQRGQQRP